MRTFILARDAAEAQRYAASAGLTPRNATIVYAPASILGLKAHEEDLVAEFEGFRERDDWQDIVNALNRAAVGAGPTWERIGKPR